MKHESKMCCTLSIPIHQSIFLFTMAHMTEKIQKYPLQFLFLYIEISKNNFLANYLHLIVFIKLSF